MSVNFLHKRTANGDKRPTASQLDIGEIAINYEAGDPGLFIEDSNGAVRKVGPCTVGGTAPNTNPAGSAGNSTGELWLDNSGGDNVLKIYDGTSWQTASPDSLTTATELAGPVVFTAQASGALTFGDVVYISGASGDTPVVSKAQANSSTTMPAYGFAGEDIASGSTGKIITFGSIEGSGSDPLDTSNLTVNDVVYVSATTAGAWTTTKPTGEGNLLQNIGRIQRVESSNGVIKVGGAGRASATPNLNEGNIFIGDSSNESSTSSLTAALNTHAGINSSASSEAVTIDSSNNVNVTAGISAGTVGSPFQASAANDLVTKDYGDTAYVTSGTLASDISSELGIARTSGTGSVLDIDITDVNFQKNIAFQQAAAFLAFQDNNSTALRIGEDDGDAYMTFDSTNGAECISFHQKLCVSADTQIDMAGSTTITLLDNDFDALDIKEGNNLYMRFNTTNSGEKLQILKNIYLAAELHLADYLLMDNQRDLRFAELNANGTNYLAFKAPAAVTTTTTFTLPDGDGADGQVLKTDGSGTLAWANALIPAASIDPVNNGDLVVEATSNTTITFKLKGSDGTVRTGTITLS